jgi:hypothetical protein
MKKTTAQRLIAALFAEGHQPIEAYNTTKYTVFKDKKSDSAYFYVGKMGALRYGSTITGSFPADKYKANVLAKYEGRA